MSTSGEHGQGTRPQLEAQRKLKEAAEEKVKNLQQEIEKTKAEMAPAQAKLDKKMQAATQQGTEQEDELMTDLLENLDLSLLPDLADPSPEELPVLDRVWHVIHYTRWSPLAKSLTASILGMPVSHIKSIIGPLWRAAVPTGDPGGNDPLNQTVILLIDAAIMKVGAKLSLRTMDERSRTKQEAKTALQSAPPKKLRTA